MRDFSAARRLLDWYDAHARDLPWRMPPARSQKGENTPAYHVWLSEIMLQQTTVVTVIPYFERFLTLWPDVRALAAANDDSVLAEWAGLGYYARARNLLKCARVICDAHNGVFPESEKELLNLPGIGPYTAAAISSIAFGQRSIVMDGNVERVMARKFDIHTPLPGAKPDLYVCADDLTPFDRAGDYAQAVMDLGATVCKPKNPTCDLCPWQNECRAKTAGTVLVLPQKTPKKPKPTRQGTAFVILTPKGTYLEKRPEKGLLGGMMGFPTTPWAESHPTATPPVKADWETLNTPVTHVFTHFALNLTVKIAVMDKEPQLPDLHCWPRDFDPNTLPTVMRKVWKAVRGIHPVSA